MIKAVPNILSGARLLLSFAMYLLEPLSAAYLCLYAACIATDPLDGFIARRYDACTRNGHLLDSFADISMAAALLVTLVPVLDWELWEMILIAAIITIRLTALIIGSIRFRRPAFIHSYLNKTAGAALFISPFLIRLIGLSPTIAMAGTVCLSASLEYLYISIHNREYAPDYRSVFLDKRRCASMGSG